MCFSPIKKDEAINHIFKIEQQKSNTWSRKLDFKF